MRLACGFFCATIVGFGYQCSVVRDKEFGGVSFSCGPWCSVTALELAIKVADFTWETFSNEFGLPAPPLSLQVISGMVVFF